VDNVLFETERLVARPWDAERDAEEAFGMYGDPEVVRFLAPATPDVATQREKIRAMIERYRQWSPRGDYGSWPLFHKQTGKLVGVGLLRPLPAFGTGALTDDIEIGWHLARGHWGFGYATEMGRALLRRGFDDLGLLRLYAVVHPENVRSLAVARRIGVEYLGRTSKYYDRELELFASNAA
jgi:RimJ/RimL family protein N-acetyltransferase